MIIDNSYDPTDSDTGKNNDNADEVNVMIRSLFDNTGDDAEKGIAFRSIFQSRIANWLQTCPFNCLCDHITNRVRGQPQAELVAINIYNYLEAVSEGRVHGNNIIIAAPSGCGKTETYRAVREFFKKELPSLIVCQVDMTSITEEGFRGKNTNSILEALNPRQNGIGIVFLDEFDKKLVSSYTSYGNNVNLAIQSQILTLIEGRNVYDNAGHIIADTQNTLFIAMGSFNACREKHAVLSKHIGFRQNGEKGYNHYDDVTREDMIGLGASYELLGRFSAVINYHALSYDAIDEIIDMNIDKLSLSTGCTVSITDNMRRILHENANGKYGCRGLYNLLHAPVMKAYLELRKKDFEIAQYSILINDVNTACCQFEINRDIDNEIPNENVICYE